MSTIRRIVTGFDANGRATIVSDGPPPPTEAVITALWATGGVPVTPADGDPVETLGSFIPPPAFTLVPCAVERINRGR